MTLPVAICACAICAGAVCWGLIWRDEYRKRKGRRSLPADVKPESAWLTGAERDSWLGIILASYSNEELDRFTKRGEVLKANRRQP